MHAQTISNSSVNAGCLRQTFADGPGLAASSDRGGDFLTRLTAQLEALARAENGGVDGNIIPVVGREAPQLADDPFGKHQHPVSLEAQNVDYSWLEELTERDLAQLREALQAMFQTAGSDQFLPLSAEWQSLIAADPLQVGKRGPNQIPASVEAMPGGAEAVQLSSEDILSLLRWVKSLGAAHQLPAGSGLADHSSASLGVAQQWPVGAGMTGQSAEGVVGRSAAGLLASSGDAADLMALVNQRLETVRLDAQSVASGLAQKTVELASDLGGGGSRALDSTPLLLATNGAGSEAGIQAAFQAEAQISSAQSGVTRSFVLEVPFQHPGWDKALGSRLQWMVNQNVQIAELRLNPPHLGPLEVRIQMDGDRAHVQFIAAHSVTRDAVDAAIPRLREMFAESGLTLGDVTVSHQGAEQRQGRFGHSRIANNGENGVGTEVTELGSETAGSMKNSNSLLDLYA